MYRPNERDNNVVTMATDAQRSQTAAIIADSARTQEAVTKRQHYTMNVNRTGYIVFSVSSIDLEIHLITVYFNVITE